MFHLSEKQFYSDFKFLSWLVNKIGIDNRKKWAGLSFIVFVPLLILSAVTMWEGRFLLKSVFFEHTDGNLILGMSFLGDSMVWPYCFLVPILLVLLQVATKKTKALIENSVEMVKTAYPETEEEIKKALEDIFVIINSSYGDFRRFIKLIPWIIALTFWFYNTATCMFNQDLEKKFYPYKSHNVVLLKKENKGVIATGSKTYEEKILLPKWDCNLHGAPLSTISTRIWTLVFYGLPPFIFFKLINLMLGVTFFLRRFERWNKRDETEVLELDKLIIKPFSADGNGGLGFIADTGMSYFYAVFFIVFLILMAFFKEGPEPSWHNYLIMLLLVPIALFSFVVPSLAARKTILEAKEKYLNLICREINGEVFESLLTGGHNGFSDVNSKVSLLKMYYDEVNGIPVWPFSSSTFLKMFFTGSFPIIMILVDKFISKMV